MSAVLVRRRTAPAPRARGGRGRSAAARRWRGFTLVEVLVALALMAVLSTLAWQGLDGMLRAREGSARVLDRTLRLNTVMAQWEQDLRAVQETLAVPALSFDGQTLRLTRRAEGGVVLVAWAVRGGRWQRWVSPVYTEAGALQDGWLRSQQLLGSEEAQLTLAEGVAGWQIYFYRGNAWTNAQSSGDLVDVAPPPAPPPPASGPGGAPPPAGGAGGVPPTGGAAGVPPTGSAGGVPPTGGTGGVPPPGAAPARERLPDGLRLVITLDGGELTRDLVLEPGG
jgi:general secretion pathway protein J